MVRTTIWKWTKPTERLEVDFVQAASANPTDKLA